jgi:hypothetical protein
MDRNNFDKIWNNKIYNGEDVVDLFESLPAPEEPNICEPAKALLNWSSQELVFDEDSSMEAIIQAKVMLLERYFGWFAAVSKQHRYHLSERGHTCIFQVFASVYARIKSVEYKVMPPLILPPPPPPPPQRELLSLGDEIR